MKRTSKRAPGSPFLIVETHTRWTKYTGTREQLIAAGVALANYFPADGKRVKRGNTEREPRFDKEFRIQLIKGGRFELTLWHPEIKPKKEQFNLQMHLQEDGNIRWTMYGTGLEDFRATACDVVSEAAKEIFEITRKEIKGQAMRGRVLKLVVPEPIAERSRPKLDLVGGNQS